MLNLEAGVMRASSRTVTGPPTSGIEKEESEVGAVHKFPAESNISLSSCRQTDPTKAFCPRLLRDFDLFGTSITS